MEGKSTARADRFWDSFPLYPGAACLACLLGILIDPSHLLPLVVPMGFLGLYGSLSGLTLLCSRRSMHSGAVLGIILSAPGLLVFVSFLREVAGVFVELVF